MVRVRDVRAEAPTAFMWSEDTVQNPVISEVETQDREKKKRKDSQL